MSKELKAAIEAVKAAPTVNIKGKEYSQVATRLEVFREHFGLQFGINTEVLHDTFDGNLVRVKAVIHDSNGVIIASGLAEEDRRVGKINQTSALENAETSAIGRALAAFGLMGSEYASSNEMVQAGVMPGFPPAMPYNVPPRQNVLEQNFQRHMEPANERAMVNARPEVIPHMPDATPSRRTHMPDFQQWTDLLGEVSAITDSIVHIDNVADLTRYWAELTPFLKVLQENDAALLSELRAAVAVRNKQLRGSSHVQQ